MNMQLLININNGIIIKQQSKTGANMAINARGRLLAVLEILRKCSNEQHPLTSTEIITKLKAIYGISADRRSVYEDIEAVIDGGYDICTYAENGKGYYLREAEFEFSELRLLVDAVLAARFISKNHSKALIEKIKKLTNDYDNRRLEKVNFINNRIKCDNVSVFLTIDVLSEAIEQGRQVEFKYLDYNINKDMVCRDDKNRKVSPYGIIWSNDFYYLIARFSWLETLTHFRIDKIKDISITEETALSITELEQYKNGFDIADYANKRVYMFSGKEERITLRCRNGILHDIIERFGDEVTINADEEGYFIAHIKGVKEGLLYFVLQFGVNIEVIKPKELRRQVKDTFEKVRDMYR